MIRFRKVVIGSMLASLIVLPTVLWATSACKVPNPNTVFCTEVPSGTVESCVAQSGGESICGESSVSIIAIFPDGAVDSSSGSTKQVQETCITTKECVWNEDTEVCETEPAGQWSITKAAKTTTGTNQCPTSEG